MAQNLQTPCTYNSTYMRLCKSQLVTPHTEQTQTEANHGENRYYKSSETVTLHERPKLKL